jgi:HEPN domain-containing protein
LNAGHPASGYDGEVANPGEVLKLSTPIVTKAEFQVLAERRLAEAKVLLDQGQWDGAYYLAGYAVELALKACIIKTLLATDAFPEREFSRNCYTHDVEKLVGLAKLDGVLKIAMHADRSLWNNWELAEDWSEEKRYHRIEKSEAEALYAAITDPAHGVLPWIISHW